MPGRASSTQFRQVKGRERLTQRSPGEGSRPVQGPSGEGGAACEPGRASPDCRQGLASDKQGRALNTAVGISCLPRPS